MNCRPGRSHNIILSPLSPALLFSLTRLQLCATSWNCAFFVLSGFPLLLLSLLEWICIFVAERWSYTSAALLQQHRPDMEHPKGTDGPRDRLPQRPDDEKVVAVTPSSSRRLHVGGKTRKQGWEILDALAGPHVDHVGDAASLHQFSDASFSHVYASHVLEHFSHRSFEKVLKEWWRVICPGGALYVSVPDLLVCSPFPLAHKKKNDVSPLVPPHETELLSLTAGPLSNHARYGQHLHVPSQVARPKYHILVLGGRHPLFLFFFFFFFLLLCA
jgi:hypothetical protein